MRVTSITVAGAAIVLGACAVTSAVLAEDMNAVCQKQPVFCAQKFRPPVSVNTVRKDCLHNLQLALTQSAACVILYGDLIYTQHCNTAGRRCCWSSVLTPFVVNCTHSTLQIPTGCNLWWRRAPGGISALERPRHLQQVAQLLQPLSCP